MVIECPKCQSKFNLDESQFAGQSLKLRCKICTHVFTHQFEGETPSLEEEFESLISAEDESKDLSQENDAPAVAINNGAQPESVIKEIDSILGSGEDVEEETGTKKETLKKKKKKSMTPLLLLLLLLLIAGGGAYYYYMNYMQVEETAPAVPEEKGPFLHIPKEQITYERSVNPDEGDVLIVKGIVIKLTTKPLDSVMLQARLYDKEKNLLETRNIYAGVIPDIAEFERKSAAEINGLLSAAPKELGEFAESREIPFIVAFFGNADGPRSVQVEIKEFNWLADNARQQ